MAKAEISWKGRNEDGIRREVYAQHVGDRWIFYVRQERFDKWQEMPEPPLEDWMELLDAVQRRVTRRLLRPEEEQRVKRNILTRYPEAKLD
jgi:hypothetical protein